MKGYGLYILAIGPLYYNNFFHDNATDLLVFQNDICGDLIVIQ